MKAALARLSGMPLVVMAGVLLCLYMALGLLVDDRGSLGTDTGAKLATLAQMSRTDSFTPDVGYWAAAYDLDGSSHPLYGTYEAENGWIAVTTLPMLLAAHPLHQLGGTSAALLLPAMGAVAAAWGVSALVALLGGPRRKAFWLAGLGTPIAVYALDFWEHSIGLALMVWAVFHAGKAVGRLGRRTVLGRGAVAGLLFGAAATMRTEAVVYAVAALVVITVVERRSVRLSLLRAAAYVLGFVAPVAANMALERVALGGALRSERSAALAGGVLSDPGLRLREALATSFDVTSRGVYSPASLILGLLLSATLIGLALSGLRKHRRWSVNFSIAAAALYALRFVGQGIGFVSGLLPASPLTAGALAGRPSGDLQRFFLGLAGLGALGVWASSYTGGAGPQWGGRYLLLTGALLAAVAIARLEVGDGVARRFLSGAAVVVTALGVTWLGVRADGVAQWREEIFTGPDQAVVSSQGFFLREFGDLYTPDRRWLSSADPADSQPEADVMKAAGVPTFDYLHFGVAPPPRLVGWVATGERVTGGLVPVRVTTYAVAS